MFTGLLSFLGGSVFRMIWGEVSHYITQKQDQANEIERMRVQAEVAAAAHSQNMEALRLQNELGIKTIEAVSDAAIAKVDADAFAIAVADVGKVSGGNDWIDKWNRAVRPYLATLAAALITLEVIQHGLILTDWDREVFGAILGMYVADRTLAHRGK
jgi:hypothetical protein